MISPKTYHFVIMGVAIIAVLGCAGYEGAVADMHSSLLSGDKIRALEKSNKALKVKDNDSLPDKLKGYNSLLLLERAMIKQSMESFKSSASDFRVSDTNLELLDLKSDTLSNIGQFIFSDDATKYKAPAYEKLLLNTFNMLNYMAIGDMEGARVESRRLRIMQKYLADEKSEQAALLDLGSYLAGLAFEAGGQTENALSFYADAVGIRSYDSLVEPIKRLASCSSYKNDNIEKFIADNGGPFPQCTPQPEGTGTLIVAASSGLVPRKTAVRIPIGAAVAIAGALLMPEHITDLNRLIARGLVTWINFPSMKVPQTVFSDTSISINGKVSPSEHASNITEKVIAAWESIKPKLIAAAIVRMVTRMIAGLATEAAVTKASGNAIGGLLAGLAVQGTMTAFDTPDTRSWTTLPATVRITRMQVPAGEHEIEVIFKGNAGQEKITRRAAVSASGYSVVYVSSMR